MEPPPARLVNTATLRQSSAVIIAWIAQTFLQLVLLPIIIVGPNVQAAADKRAEQTYKDAEALAGSSARNLTEGRESHEAPGRLSRRAAARRRGVSPTTAC